jgi:catechol 2,3-dioxygenase-like lactoylglutathione lyase family enzyme
MVVSVLIFSRVLCETLNFEDMSMPDWFARPILQVKDVDASLCFYRNLLGFTIPWRYEEEGRARVAQVDRQGCALILANNLVPEKMGKAVMFISLNVDPATPGAATAALDALRAELEAKGVAVKEDSWGYRLLVVDDLDGNQLFFNYPSEDASAGIGKDEWNG